MTRNLSKIIKAVPHLNRTELEFCFELFNNCTVNGTRQQDLQNKYCIDFNCACLPEPSSACSEKRIVECRHFEIPPGVLAVFIVIAASSLVANGFICAVYSLSKEIRTAKHYFIVNLGIADMLIAVLAVPCHLTEYIQCDSKTLCQIGSMVDVLCCTSSITSFTAIGVERFVAIKYPLRYHAIVSRKRCLITLCVMWTYSIAFALASRIPVGEFDMQNCVFFTDAYIISTTFGCFILPLWGMLFTYGCIYKIAMHQARQIQKCSPHVSTRMKREFKAAKTLTLIIGVFVLCWLPFFSSIWIFSLYRVSVPHENLHHVVQIVRFLNGLANPFIYAGINREFRRSALKLLKRIFLSKKWSTSQKKQRKDSVHRSRREENISSFIEIILSQLNSK